MNTHVDFETAKLLKEKGFDEWCKSYYRKNLLNSAEPIGTIKIIHNTWKNDIVLGYEFIEHHYEFYAAPTIADVVCWIYKEHDIWISVEQNTYEDKFDYLITQRNKDSSWFVVDNDEKIIKSPTEAYTEAIKYTLNNLI